MSRDDMPPPKLIISAGKIGAEVTEDSARNEKITKKILEVRFRAYAYASVIDVRTHCHVLRGTSRLEPEPMRTHLKIPCRVVTLCPSYRLRCADDLSHRSLRATDGRNG
ncbi:hypothetical protein PIB30_091177, partial [Stylosanthes scabra]|nr:hypothetical protein [Stylosanthes scabra]